MRQRLPDRKPWDYIAHWRDHRWDLNWIERPRLWGSAVALALGGPKTVCDPACGDSTVVAVAYQISAFDKAYLGDISPDTINKLVPGVLPFETERFVGDLHSTLEAIPPVDAIVLTEILEHLEDPDAVLRLARTKARWLAASSPICPDGTDHTDQHIWAFDMEGYREMLEAAGWTPRTWFTANAAGHPYAAGFQIWGCE